MAGIFISYRRSDSAAMCDRIYAALMQHFGKDAIFKDIDNIPLGVNFADYIRSVMAQAAVALIVIGRTWLDVTDAQGNRRLDDPGDFVRLEIEEALARNIPVIPLRVDGAPMPSAERLPASLRGLLMQNGWEVHYDPYFETDIRHVKAGLERWVPSLQARLAEYARQQEASRQAAVAAEAARLAALRVSAPASYPPGYYGAVVPARPKAPLPRWRVLLYGAGSGLGAIVALVLYILFELNILHAQSGSSGSTALGDVVSAMLFLVGTIPAFVIVQKYNCYWAGVRAALVAGLIAWLGIALVFLISDPQTLQPSNPASYSQSGITINEILFVVFVALVGAVLGAASGMLGGLAAMLWTAIWRPVRRLLPARKPSDVRPAAAQPVAVTVEAPTDTPAT